MEELKDIEIKEEEIKEEEKENQEHVGNNNVHSMINMYNQAYRNGIPGAGGQGGNQGGNQQRNLNGNRQQNRNGQLVQEAEALIPVVVPKRNSWITTREASDSKIEELHRNLEKYESEAFSVEERRGINRKRFNALKNSDKEKRFNKAIDRQVNAKRLKKIERDMSKDPAEEIKLVDEATFLEKLKTFTNFGGKILDMKSDEQFVANFKSNYKRCTLAEEMKVLVADAVQNGYFPKKVDLDAVEAQIAGYEDLKLYLDVQKELIKNPYYQFMAKEDISYNKSQLAALHRKLEEDNNDENLKQYIENMIKIKDLSFVRKKGMSSVASKNKTAGKHAATLLREKNEKRKVIDTLSERVLDYEGDSAFLDKDSYKDLTQEEFEAEKAAYKKLKLENLHFKSIKDFADHFKENAYIFKENRKFEDILANALTKGFVPGDEEMLDLRAKIRAIRNVEAMVNKITVKIMYDPDAALNETTNEEIWQAAFDKLNEERTSDGDPVMPSLGANLTKYCNDIRSSMKVDHKKRNETISKIYTLTHTKKVPTGQVDEDGEPVYTWEKSKISREELRKQSGDYEKNVYLNEYQVEMNRYVMTTVQDLNASTLRVFARKNGLETNKDIKLVNGRILSQYVAGMSAKQLQEIYRIQYLGSQDEKDRLYGKIYDEYRSMDFAELSQKTPEAQIRNIPYKVRWGGIFMSLGGPGEQGWLERYRDEGTKNHLKSLYRLGCAHFNDSINLGNLFAWKDMRCIPPEELQKLNPVDLNSYASELSTNAENQGEIGVKDGNMVFTKTEKDTKAFARSTNAMFTNFMPRFRIDFDEDKFAKGEIGQENVRIAIYEELKASNLVKDTTGEQLKKVRDFYKSFGKEKTEENQLLIKKIHKNLNLPYDKDNAARYSMLTDIARLTDEDVNTSGERFKYLMMEEQSDDPAVLQKNVKACEDIFRILMSFDLGKFKFDSYRDLVSNKQRFTECEAIISLAKQMDKYLTRYNNLIGMDQIKCLLNEEHINEIKTRCNLIKQAECLFSYEDYNVILDTENNALQSTDKTLEEVTNMTDEEYKKNAKDAKQRNDPAAEKFWRTLQAMFKDSRVYGLNVELKNLEGNQRYNDKLYGKSREQEILSLLASGKTVFDRHDNSEIDFRYADTEAFGNLFAKKFSVSKQTERDRDRDMEREGQELHSKYQWSKTLVANRDKEINRGIRARRSIRSKERRLVGEEALNLLSVFMKWPTDELLDDQFLQDQYTEDNNKMVSRYADKNKRSGLLDELTKTIMKAEINIDVTSDENFAANAEKMEKISKMARSYDALLKANPEYVNKLNVRAVGDEHTNYEMLQMKLNRMLAISDFYRAKSLLMTDTYYIRHKNKELSENHDEESTNEQRRVADLIHLVKICSDRLSKGDIVRDDRSMESVLQQHELIDRQQAYLTGRVDLTISISNCIKQDDEISRFWHKLSELSGFHPEDTFLLSDLIEEQNEPFNSPELEPLKTKSVKRFIKMLVNTKKINKAKLSGFYDEKGKAFNEELAKHMEGLGSFKLVNPKTGDKLELNTSPVRTMAFIMSNFYGSVPNEELLEMVDGFNVVNRENLDLNKEEDYEYAKRRWLESVKQLFYLQYNCVKRFESTYGTLLEQMPPGILLKAIGDDEGKLRVRLQFGQDMSEMANVKTSFMDGKAVSMAEYLVKMGLIKENEYLDAATLNNEFYQMGTSFCKHMMEDPDHLLENGPEVDPGPLPDSALQNNIKVRRNMIGGPHLSHSEERKLWKEVMGKGPKGRRLYSSKTWLEFKKNVFNLYSADELNNIKLQRKKDANAILRYEHEVKRRKEELTTQIVSRLNINIEDEQKKKTVEAFVWFHPGMTMSESEAGFKDKENEFYEMVKTCLETDDLKKGENEKDDNVKNKIKKRQALYRKMIDRLSSFNSQYGNVKDTQFSKYIDSDSQEFVNKSPIMTTLIVGGACDAMQEMMRAENNKHVIEQETFKEFRKIQKLNTAGQGIRAARKSLFFRSLKDIGSMQRTRPEMRFADLENYVAFVDSKVDTEPDQFTEENRALLKEFGINIYSDSEILGEKEEEK